MKTIRTLALAFGLSASACLGQTNQQGIPFTTVLRGNDALLIETNNGVTFRSRQIVGTNLLSSLIALPNWPIAGGGAATNAVALVGTNGVTVGNTEATNLVFWDSGTVTYYATNVNGTINITAVSSGTAVGAIAQSMGYSYGGGNFTGGTNSFPPAGGQPWIAFAGSDPRIQFKFLRSGTLSNFNFAISGANGNAVGSGSNVTATAFKNGVATSWAGSAVGNGSDNPLNANSGSTSVAINAGDTIAIQTVNNTAASWGTRYVQFYFEFIHN